MATSTLTPPSVDDAAPDGSRPARPRRTRSPLPFGLLLPAVLALGLALGYPLVRQVVLSLQEFGLAQQFGRPAEWVGLQNYRELVGDPYLWKVVLRSVLFCLVNAAVTMAVGVGLALLMQRMSKPVRLLVQSGLLLAWAMPVLAALTVWQWLFDSQYGVVNWLLTKAGGDYAGHSWLLEPLSFFLVASVIVVWMSVPFVAFTAYAALTQVPAELVEAAAMDGASPRQRLRHVVLPTVSPVLLVVGLLQVIWDLRVFTQIYVLQKAGGTTRDTNLLGTYIYRLGIGSGDFGTAAAVAVFMLALTVVLTAPYVRLMLRQEES
ncbi:carbohydrate ABC transporter permease [Nocardioides lianchengensis]|jgi:N,N'-diacetylchitobiose transport system permease protein|uniref:N,N'-diacetylchitobiose transport system permease protein n=1 Tax=Nocardioides lianchengensis TaxID=1045774 RepID=A0A1G6KVI3_9ACTN|nr:sugar ABC transporter permease [Nocardioides lianchengensis]NYG13711.1 N,N'-diacetylchitobiose transport system permease protein [Nocardioides lianchengensis]SDC34957.1 N,N'-diacetylchitobiose transport system permease protein [Nocardioides lianchengensis]